jgi:hypothetical protein
MSRNPFRKNSEQFESVKGEDVLNVREETIVQFPDQDGNLRQYVTESVVSEPDGQGGYVNRTYRMPVYDRFGNPLPDDPGSVVFSHSHLPIGSDGQLAFCTSIFHPGGVSRNILVGHDGRLTAGGAICSRCSFWHSTIYMVLGVLAVGAIVGLFKAVALF